MLVYKDGITRTIEPREEQKYKDLGYVEVKEEADCEQRAKDSEKSETEDPFKASNQAAPKVEEAPKEEDEQPKGKRR